MASNPVQVVLNADSLRRTPDRQGGGAPKDFYEGRDDEFALHRNQLMGQLDLLQRSLPQQFGGIGYARVKLAPSALAKSHRPTQSLFRPTQTPTVGATSLGHLLLQVTPESLDTISSRVSDAEEKPRKVFDRKTEKEDERGRRERDEVGAIESVQRWAPADKRQFSVSAAIQWLSEPRTGGGYLVQLFDWPPPKNNWDALSTRKRLQFQSFMDGLSAMSGMRAEPTTFERGGMPLLRVRLETLGDGEPSTVSFQRSVAGHGRRRSPRVNLTQDRNAALLQFLDQHPLVRYVELPGYLARSSGRPTGRALNDRKLFVRDGGTPYPRVAIVDGGIAGALDAWRIHRWGLIAAGDSDLEHGTRVGSLVVSAKSLNTDEIAPDPDGCDLIDVDVLPTDGQFATYYPNGIADFFDELETAVADIKAKLGARVFNLSLNVVSQVNLDRYSAEAARLDRISETYDVVFVISGGNLLPANCRPEWDGDPAAALSQLAASRDDGLFVPAESLRNVSVTALNPPEIVVPRGFANYSRRGPGLRAGIKPDFGHFGGAGTRHAVNGTGLFSVDAAGRVSDACGTSFAAPLVARALSKLESSIEGDPSRETLIALLVHHAKVPDSLSHDQLSAIARDLVGYGIPSAVDQMLTGDDDEITLLFSTRLRDTQELWFDFPWPSQLVGPEGGCTGQIKVTLVSTPPIDERFGSELVRANLDARLQQEQRDGRFKNRLEPAYLEGAVERVREKELITHALKWSPVKFYTLSMRRYQGVSSNWRLVVECLSRAEPIPQEGIPFSVLLTISDPKGKPIFNEMRQTLMARGIQTVDVRTAARVVQRV